MDDHDLLACLTTTGSFCFHLHHVFFDFCVGLVYEAIKTAAPVLSSRGVTLGAIRCENAPLGGLCSINRLSKRTATTQKQQYSTKYEGSFHDYPSSGSTKRQNICVAVTRLTREATARRQLQFSGNKMGSTSGQKLGLWLCSANLPT